MNMNTKLKSMLLLLITLVMGIIVGVLGSRLFMEYRISKMRSMRGERLLVHRFEEILQPTPQQAPEIRKVIEKYQGRFFHLQKDFRSEAKMVLDSLHQELEPLLTDEQKKRLRERRKHLPFPPRRSGHKPPWGPPR